jgi:sec-independent protein translocase protein TatB
MLDVGWQELFLIGVVTLIVVGPKDLPKVLRSTARVLNKARAMSREFQAGLAEMAREAELDEIKRNVERTARFDPDEEVRNTVDPTGKLSAEFDPAEFNRKLKESVEASPPARYPRPPTPTATQSPPALQDPVPEYPLGDVFPADVTGGPTASQPSAAKRGSAPAED